MPIRLPGGGIGLIRSGFEWASLWELLHLLLDEGEGVEGQVLVGGKLLFQLLVFGIFCPDCLGVQFDMVIYLPLLLVRLPLAL